MVWKCSVPGCTSSARIPSHALPADGRRAEAWLNAVGLSNMIGKLYKQELMNCKYYPSKLSVNSLLVDLYICVHIWLVFCRESLFIALEI